MIIAYNVLAMVIMTSVNEIGVLQDICLGLKLGLPSVIGAWAPVMRIDLVIRPLACHLARLG